MGIVRLFFQRHWRMLEPGLSDASPQARI